MNFGNFVFRKKILEKLGLDTRAILESPNVINPNWSSWLCPTYSGLRFWHDENQNPRLGLNLLGNEMMEFNFAVRIFTVQIL